MDDISLTDLGLARKERNDAIARAEAAERERDNVISLYQASVREGVLVEAIADTLRAEDRLEAAEADRARLLAANAMLAADLGAAERDAAKWREMHADRDLQHEYARANASEAECEHLTTALNLIDEARANALAECERLREKMSALYRRVDLVDGATDEPVQFVGVYVTRWGESEPTVAFVQWDDDHAAGG
jgi:hypothetical protein